MPTKAKHQSTIGTSSDNSNSGNNNTSGTIFLSAYIDKNVKVLNKRSEVTQLKVDS